MGSGKILQSIGSPCWLLFLVCGLLVTAQLGTAQQATAEVSQAEPAARTILDTRCSGCHAPQEQGGKFDGIESQRKTPEGWQTSIRRMVSLHDVRLTPTAAREIVRYLSDRQGIAPEELRPALFEVERRLIDHDYEGDSGVEFTCIQCHSMGRVMTQRRTKDEWSIRRSPTGESCSNSTWQRTGTPRASAS